MLEAVREGGLLPPGAPVVAMLSGGGTRSACSTSRCVCSGPSAVTALHVNYGLRDDSDADEAHCAALCERLGVRLEVERPRRPEGPGNLQAWARDTRYAAAARLAEADDGADRHRPHRRRPGRDDPLPARLLAQPPRAARDASRATAGWCGRCSASPARRRPPTARSAGSTWRDDPSNAEVAYARNRVRHGLAAALAEIHPAAARNVLRTAELLRDEAEVLDALVAAELDGSNGSAARHDRARAPRRAAPGAAPPRRPAARRPRRRPPGRRRRPPRRRGRRPAPHRHRDARPRRRRPRGGRARRPARRA